MKKIFFLIPVLIFSCTENHNLNYNKIDFDVRKLLANQLIILSEPNIQLQSIKEEKLYLLLEKELKHYFTMYEESSERLDSLIDYKKTWMTRLKERYDRVMKHGTKEKKKLYKRLYPTIEDYYNELVEDNRYTSGYSYEKIDSLKKEIQKVRESDVYYEIDYFIVDDGPDPEIKDTLKICVYVDKNSNIFDFRWLE